MQLAACNNTIHYLLDSQISLSRSFFDFSTAKNRLRSAGALKLAAKRVNYGKFYANYDQIKPRLHGIGFK